MIFSFCYIWAFLPACTPNCLLAFCSVCLEPADQDRTLGGITYVFICCLCSTGLSKSSHPVSHLDIASKWQLFKTRDKDNQAPFFFKDLISPLFIKDFINIFWCFYQRLQILCSSCTPIKHRYDDDDARGKTREHWPPEAKNMMLFILHFYGCLMASLWDCSCVALLRIFSSFQLNVPGCGVTINIKQ